MPTRKIKFQIFPMVVAYSHTPHPPIRGKEGSGDHAYNELFWRQDLVASNQIRDLNLLLGNALPAARARPRCLQLSVTCFVIIAFRRNSWLYAWSPDPLSLLRLKGVASETTCTCRY